jgi:hypothetical protein
MTTPFCPQPKPTRRSTVKRKAARVRQLTRAQCRQIVLVREKHRCQQCGRRVTDDCDAWLPQRAHVHEIPGRFKDKTAAYRPEACQLLCHACHLPNGVHRSGDRTAR